MLSTTTCTCLLAVVAVVTAGDDTSYGSLSNSPSDDWVADLSSLDSYADNLHVDHEEEAQSWWETEAPDSAYDAKLEAEIAELEQSSFDLGSFGSFGSYSSMDTQIFNADGAAAPAATAARSFEISNYLDTQTENLVLLGACVATLCAVGLIMKKRAEHTRDLNDPSLMGEWMIPIGSSPGQGAFNEMHDQGFSEDAASFV
jgi:hypothetical protein